MEDEKDFMPATKSSSKLASLFDVEIDITQTPSLSPKAVPRKVKANTESPRKPKLEVLYSKPVYTFRLIDGKYVGIGRLGLAFVGSISSQIFQIILYSNQKEVVCTVQLQRGPSITLLTDTSLAILDHSVTFDNKDDLDEFLRHVLLGRYFSSKDPLIEPIWEIVYIGDSSKQVDQFVDIILTFYEILDDLKTNLKKELIVINPDEKQFWLNILKNCFVSHKRVIILPNNVDNLIKVEIRARVLAEPSKNVEHTTVSEVQNQNDNLMLKNALRNIEEKVDAVLAKISEHSSPDLLKENRELHIRLGKLQLIHKRCFENDGENNLDKNEEKVKSLMNTLYRELTSNFEDNDQFSGLEIKKVIADTIRGTTASFLKNASSR